MSGKGTGSKRDSATAASFGPLAYELVAHGDQLTGVLVGGFVLNFHRNPAVLADVPRPLDVRQLTQKIGVLQRRHHRYAIQSAVYPEEGEDLAAYLVDDLAPGIVLPGILE